jgi:CHASE2 domain-containing sensor protein
MDVVNAANALCYSIMVVLCVLLAKHGHWVPVVIIGTVALHGLLYSTVYFYRTLAWDVCPPQCGLGPWAASLRLHSLIAIVLGMADRLWVRHE